MSSLYGAGHADAQTSAIAAQTDAGKATAAQTSSFTNSKQVEAYVRASYADEPVLIDIASCESNFRQFDETGQVLRGRVNKGDVGVMQINEKYHADEAVKMDLNIYTIEGNMAFAKHLYEKYGTDPWSSSAPCWTQLGGLAKK